jgi:hypothetical protein
MKKTIASFIETLQDSSNGVLKGGFAGIKGGKSLDLSTNYGACSNQSTCNSTNSGGLISCSNSGDCSGSTNTGNCTNKSCSN